MSDRSPPAAADHADVLIVGAGPAGAGLAYLLARNALHVRLLDRSDFPRDKTCGDCLSPRALRVLDGLGLTDDLVAAGRRIARVCMVAPNGRTLSAPIRPAGDLPGFALIVPRLRLDDLIRRRAVAAGVEFQAPVHVTDLVWADGRVVGVRATSPAGPVELRARQVVLATGAATGLLERGGLLTDRPAFVRAARGYYEGVPGLDDAIEIYLHSIPMPGYGWVFPVSDTAANVGVGYGAPSRTPPRQPPLAVLDQFVTSPPVAIRLDGARPAGPPRAYPLRIDFATARPAVPGALLVGEACGLVHPMTGEGIDCALESAELAADVLTRGLRDGAPAVITAGRYTRAVRSRFLPAFSRANRVRDLLARRWALNRLVAAASRHEHLQALFVHAVLGGIDPGQLLAPRALLQLALG